MTRPRDPTTGATTNAAFAAVIVLGGCAVLLWLGGAAAISLAGGDPRGALECGLRALAHPRHPASAWPAASGVPGPGPYWAVTATVVVTALVLCVFGWRRWGSAAAPPTAQVRDLPGTATRSELVRAAGKRALQRRARIVRPSLTRRAAPAQLGYRLGRSRGAALWFAVEDSALLLGPPRSGKGLHCVIPWILDAPGPVVTTSTRPDNLATTYAARQRRGPVAVFDPQRLAGAPDGLRWSMVRGCARPHTALVRARGLASGVGFHNGGLSDSDFWSGQTESVLRCLLHAAALEDRGASDLYRWSLTPAAAEDAVTILDSHPAAATGWADTLQAPLHADPRTRDSVWLGVRQALAALADPDVLAAVDPGPADRFDPAEFLAADGTVYLLATRVGSGSCAPLIAAFVEDITETARQLAARSPGGRLDPPLLLALDELANLTPLPSLPQLMAEGGGSGITTLAVLQSLAQARDRWGEHAADAIWDAATVKLVFGGLGKVRDLEDLSRLIGERDETTTSISRGAGVATTTATSMRRVPVMAPDLLRTLPDRQAVLLLRRTRPAVLDLTPWTHRRDAATLRAGRAAFENDIRNPITRKAEPS
jgi:type IV secretion system protein VirD4